MTRFDQLRNRRWTPLEVAIWFLALVAVIVSGALLVTKGTGSWALLIGSLLVVALALLRYRAEAVQENRNARNHDK
jgi:hypothetical protein